MSGMSSRLENGLYETETQRHSNMFWEYVTGEPYELGQEGLLMLECSQREIAEHLEAFLKRISSGIFRRHICKFLSANQGWRLNRDLLLIRRSGLRSVDKCWHQEERGGG